MGTRADFYVGRGPNARWLGSIAFDGFPDSLPDSVMRATTEDDYVAAVAAFAAERDDWTKPADGWPWPWEDSTTTDYAYAFDDGATLISLGRRWITLAQHEELSEEDHDRWYSEGPVAVFPKFGGAAKAVTYGPRSGLIVVGGI